nr:ribonuclease H-like domain-containing protein [Tanacetum cinerariifolium]
MVAYLSKSDASEGFNQIIDFLNGSSIKYALTVNPKIYVSCIKQFWTTVVVKQVNDVTRLQDLVDKKNIVVKEATIREALYLDDAEGVDCLPNKEIFVGLARMGYEKPSTKLTFYKAFFSSQWKFLIHTILQCMSTKRTSWNEFSSSMASAVICLFSGNLSTHTTKYTSPALTQKVNAAGTIVPTVGQNPLNSTNTFSVAGPLNVVASPTYGKSSFINASQLPDDPDMPELEDVTYSDDEDDVGVEADFNNLETSITVSPIPTTRVHKDHHVSQIIEEPKRVHQALKDPSWIEAMQEELLQFKMQKVWILVDLPHGKRAIGFENPDHPDKVYKVVKALYGLHQAPRAWYETFANYLLQNGFQRGKVDQTLFIKKHKERKSASTPIDTEKPLLKDLDGEDVDVHTYSCCQLLCTSAMDSESTAGLWVVPSGMESLKRISRVTNIISAGYLTTQQMVLNSPCLTYIRID